MPNFFSILLSPFAVLYGIIVKVRNYLFDWRLLKSVSFEKPIICVGNITVGGTGKTPHVEYLLKLLSNDLKVATLSRGYGRKTKGFLYVETASTSNQVGDEPLQMKLKYPAVTVAVDGDRRRGITKLIEDKPEIGTIILDDAMQHRWVKPGLTILLIDYNRLITRDFFLPIGRLRDSVKEKRRASIIIITKCPLDLNKELMNSVVNELNISREQKIYFTGIGYGDLKPVFDIVPKSKKLNKDQDVFAFAGVANPIFFYSFIKNESNLIETYTFADHFAFSKSKISPIFENYLKRDSLDKLIVTTEKDAARIRGIEGLSEEFKKALFYIPIEIKFVDGNENSFKNQILTYARKN